MMSRPRSSTNRSASHFKSESDTSEYTLKMQAAWVSCQTWVGLVLETDAYSMAKHDFRSICSIARTLELVGDKWTSDRSRFDVAREADLSGAARQR